MAVLLIFGTTAVAVAFMVVFFVAICREGRRIKIYQVLKVDTELSSHAKLPRETASVAPLAKSLHQADGVAKVLAMRSRSGAVDNSKEVRRRKPA